MLKKLIISVFCCLSLTSIAQEWELGKNSIKLDFFQFIFSGNIELDYERYFNLGSSVLVSVGYTFNGVSSQFRNYDRWGMTGEIQYRKFLLPYQPSKNYRVYMGPFLRYKFLEYQRTEVVTEYVQNPDGTWIPVDITYDSIDQFSSYYTGFIIGYNSYWGKSVEFDAFIGAGVKINGRAIAADEYDYLQTKTFGAAVNPGYTGVLPRIGVRLGGLF